MPGWGIFIPSTWPYVPHLFVFLGCILTFYMTKCFTCVYLWGYIHTFYMTKCVTFDCVLGYSYLLHCQMCLICLCLGVNSYLLNAQMFHTYFCFWSIFISSTLPNVLHLFVFSGIHTFYMTKCATFVCVVHGQHNVMFEHLWNTCFMLTCVKQLL